MTKAELRAQLMNDTISFVMNGGHIEEIPAKRVKTKAPVRGRVSANNAAGGSAPTFRISSIYNTD